MCKSCYHCHCLFHCHQHCLSPSPIVMSVSLLFLCNRLSNSHWYSLILYCILSHCHRQCHFLLTVFALILVFVNETDADTLPVSVSIIVTFKIFVTATINFYKVIPYHESSSSPIQVWVTSQVRVNFNCFLYLPLFIYLFCSFFCFVSKWCIWDTRAPSLKLKFTW